jgi:hypothetical protein
MLAPPKELAASRYIINIYKERCMENWPIPRRYVSEDYWRGRRAGLLRLHRRYVSVTDGVPVSAATAVSTTGRSATCHVSAQWSNHALIMTSTAKNHLPPYPPVSVPLAALERVSRLSLVDELSIIIPWIEMQTHL